DRVNCVVFSSDEKLLLLAYNTAPIFIMGDAERDYFVQLWRVEDWSTFAPRLGRSDYCKAYALALHPQDGRTIAISDNEKIIEIWEYKNPVWYHRKTLRGHTEAVRQLVYSPDGTILCSISDQDGTAIVWETGSGRKLAVLPAHSNVI